MQPFIRSTLMSTLQRINIVAENHSVRQASFKNSLAKIIPEKPKKPKTALELFLCEVQPQILAENPDLSHKEIKKIARELWNDLSSSEKLPFKEVARKGLEKYNEEYQLYICNLSDEESAAKLLKHERLQQAAKLRAFREKLEETGKPRKPGPSFSLFAADFKAQSDYDANFSQAKYHELAKIKWHELPEEKRLEYNSRAKARMKLHNEEMSQWGEKITKKFSKWDDIHDIATEKKTIADFGRPVKPPSAFLLFMDDVKFEEYGQTNSQKSDLNDFLLKWDGLGQEEKDEYIAIAQKLHEDYEKELDEWNKKMNETLGPWASKIHSSRS